MRLRISSPVCSGLFSFSLLWMIAGCDLGASRVAARPVLQVNDKALTAKEFSGKLARRLKNFDAISAKDPSNVRRAKEDILRVFILHVLVVDYAEANKIEIADAELEKEVNSFRSSYPDDLSFRRVLAEENLSVSDWKEEMRHSMLEKKVFAKISEKTVPPTEDEIRKHYETNKEMYKRKDRIYLRQIIIDDFTKAQNIRDELKKKDFVELAKKYSVSPEAKNGGLVGWVEKGSVDIFDKAFTLAVGSMSQVLESSYGFHIFKVERKAGPGYASLDEVRPEIVRVLAGKKEQAEFSGWLDKQIRASRVLRDNELLSAITVETRSTQ